MSGSNSCTMGAAPGGGTGGGGGGGSGESGGGAGAGGGGGPCRACKFLHQVIVPSSFDFPRSGIQQFPVDPNYCSLAFRRGKVLVDEAKRSLFNG
ncbi:hypothetical protein Taro_010425 [Colocasia esculenta]|uniref:Uncharacterized protein n=1 Tax=Colocasia esculenta TaxID=4460 RepID=A0A843U7M8_COLES|nr:hypothetical protein [Colocasia esculenta]